MPSKTALFAGRMKQDFADKVKAQLKRDGFTATDLVNAAAVALDEGLVWLRRIDDRVELRLPDPPPPPEPEVVTVVETVEVPPPPPTVEQLGERAAALRKVVGWSLTSRLADGGPQLVDFFRNPELCRWILIALFMHERRAGEGVVQWLANTGRTDPNKVADEVEKILPFAVAAEAAK